MKEVLPWTRRIPRAIFLGIAGWFILSVPFFIVFEESARTALWKHDPSDVLFRELGRLAAKAFGVGAAFLVLALLLGKANLITLGIAFAANAGLLLAIWRDGTFGKDLVIIVPLCASLVCLVFEGYGAMVSQGRTA